MYVKVHENKYFNKENLNYRINTDKNLLIFL
jgi:hypothetical protein